MLPGALHRNGLPRTVREQPGDAIMQTIGMAVVAVAPASVGHPTRGPLRGGGGPFRSNAGVEQLMSQVNDRGLGPGGRQARRPDLLDLMVERGIVAGDVHG